jgi:protein SMG6
LLQLPENVTLAGFTPLSFYESEEHVFYYYLEDLDTIQNSVRLYKLHEFCANFLCSCDPPVLKKVHDDHKPNYYVSVIQNNKTNNSDILLETTDDLQNETSIQGDFVNNYSVVSNELISNIGADNENNLINNVSNDMISKSCENDSETRILLQKKDELERQHKLQEMDKQRLQKILRESTIGLHIEVRPKYLIPDTNCFVDCLSSIETIAQAYPTYQLMVPLVVLNELEGLSRGGRNVSKTKSFPQQSGQTIDLLSHSPTHKTAADESELQHAIKVARISKEALTFLKSINTIKCVTSRGSILSTATFTVEDDSTEPMSNDDKILATALNLCKTENDKLSDTGEIRQVFRKVVLLTTDRNLRVKALSRDVPVREMSDFIKWAGLEKSSS